MREEIIIIFLSRKMSRKRTLSSGKDEQTECISLSKKIKNFHLNSVQNDVSAINGEEVDLTSFNLSDQAIGNVDELNQRLLSEQIVNYSNSIISNTYSPDTGSENNKSYLKINKILFEANKMRLLRNQVRLLNKSQ